MPINAGVPPCRRLPTGWQLGEDHGLKRDAQLSRRPPRPSSLFATARKNTVGLESLRVLLTPARATGSGERYARVRLVDRRDRHHRHPPVPLPTPGADPGGKSRTFARNSRTQARPSIESSICAWPSGCSLRPSGESTHVTYSTTRCSPARTSSSRVAYSRAPSSSTVPSTCAAASRPNTRAADCRCPRHQPPVESPEQ